ncbi:mucin-5B-like isoform X2 [Tachypleus tridentatus]|uniref:mucin-5B-like isoform X2 n=1 Tax=Tachypleus tridentatus TaxID=6853 RepID=UPI003FD27C2D
MFDFQGDCEYILSKGKLDKSRSFTVIIKNVPCGTSGVTCSKSLTVDVGGEEKVTLTQNKPVPKTGYTSNFIVREVGLFVSVYTKHGVTVQWDKGTRVYVRVDTKWKGRLKGLCGNFDDDQSNDFRTPSGGPPEARPVVFGNSWKVHESCPYPRDIKDTCLLHPQRRTWALSKCGVLKSDIFKPCHSEVSLDPYYERCVFDACACDSGGDCECLCTALAAYAQECNFHGVPIKWRSQELCPIQCEDCAEYQACLSTCPKLTCETQYLYATLNEDCAFEPCVEGCETKPCPFGQIYNNDREFKCIPIVDCQVPCKKINGKVYMEGERVTDPETVDPCQSCFCQKGELICEGEPCATSTTRAYQRDKYPCKKTGWTPWMNSPYQVGGDYELLEDLQLFQVYSEYCGTDNITKIECRVVGSKKSIKAARQYATCDLPKGLVCNDREQTSGMCQDYEIRVYCQCKAEPVISPSTTPLIITEVVTVVELPSECTAPGWTFWMNSNKPDEIGDDESIGELRKKYVFCPESEIEKVECRVASTKSSYEFSKDQNVQCSKEGLICKNSGRGDFSTCADYEVRFYCKCADTACDFPRGMEKDYISGQEVSVSSFRSPSTLGNKARLNGNSAWSAEYLSTDQWIQVDLQELQDVTGVITQGSPLQPEWVTAYKVSYSRDNVAFSVVKSPDGSETVFTGNNDQNTPVTNKFDEPLKVRFVRIIPFQWKGWISLRLEILGCNREIPVGTTTVPPCVPGWTRYFNIDSPKSGDGDIELFKDIRTKYDLCEDSFIQKIECRSFVNGQMVDHTETGDVGIKCSINKGLVCLNWLQKKGKLCHDYSIRVYCGCGPIHTETESITPVVTTSSVTIPTCTEGWTNFYNTDVPFTGGGDFESVKELIKKYQFCSVDQVIDINCKASVKSPLKGAGEQLVDWKETGDKAVECSTSKGLVCYNNQQGKGGKCHDYSIQLYCQCVPEPRHRVLCNWTDWWNKDDPDGEGDIESIEMYQNEYGVCRKPELKAIECRLSKTKHDYREVRQKVTCDIDTGLSCYNKHQIGKCHDYEVRFFCAGDECPGTVPTKTKKKPRPKITIIPPTKPTPCVSSWTPFFNTDSPTSGEGDIELLVNIQKRGSVCFDKYIAGIECKTRIGKTVVDYTESGDFGVKCSLAVGLVCENSLQKKGRRCHDYSIRFFCSCVKPKTTTPQPVITTSPCPLTQVYDDCGYRCNQTCQSFFNLLVKEQKCVLGTPSDLCIPGCRPTKTCSAPYVWRDYSTCVRKEECTCVLPDGTILSPGRVIDYNCQKCQCQDNHLICIPIPHCGETPTKEVFTQPTPTHAEQNRCWTNWINIDSPLSGSGDMEDLTEIRLKYSLCSNPLAIECRVVSSKESSVDAGQNAECDLKTGLHCWNNVNGDEGCYDYEIRLLCPCPGSTTSTSFLSTTTPQPTCTSGWTKWFSSHIVDGKGDYETLQNIQSKGFKLPCESNMITAIECRPIGIPSGVPKQNIVCDIKLGFICENRQGKGGQTCYDYEVRFLCECEGTTVTAEVTTESSVTSPLVTTVVIVPTTPSVLPPCTNYKHLISGPTPLPDENLKASSSLNSNSEPQNSRLTLQKGPNSDGAWIPAYFDKDQYLEVDLGKTQPVYGIIVKGQDKGQSWVTAFRVMYSSNDQSFSFVTESSNYKVAKVSASCFCSSVILEINDNLFFFS